MNVHPVSSLAVMLNDWTPELSLADGVARLSAWMGQLATEEQVCALALLHKGARKRLVTLAEVQEELMAEQAYPPWLWQACVAQARDPTEACALWVPVDPGKAGKQSSLSDATALLAPVNGKAVKPVKEQWVEVYHAMDVPGRYYWLKMLQGGFKSKIPPAVLSAWIQMATGATPWQASRVLEEATLGSKVLLQDLTKQIGTAGLHPVVFPEIRDCTTAAISEMYATMPDAAFLVEALPTGRWVQWQRHGNAWALWDMEGVDLSAQCPAWQTLVPEALGNVHFTACWLSPSPGGEAVLQVMDLHEWNGRPLSTMPLSERLSVAATFCQACGPLSPAIGDALLYKSVSELQEALQKKQNEPGATALLIRTDALPEAGVCMSMAAPRLMMKGVLLYTQWEQKEGLTSQWLSLGMWNGTQWVTVCKVKNTLEVPYLSMLQAWIKKNVTDKTGPVRLVAPVQVLQFSCATVLPSKRHKCGFQVVDPRLETWLRTEVAEEIPGLLEQLKSV